MKKTGTVVSRGEDGEFLPLKQEDLTSVNEAYQAMVLEEGPVLNLWKVMVVSLVHAVCEAKDKELDSLTREELTDLYTEIDRNAILLAAVEMSNPGTMPLSAFGALVKGHNLLENLVDINAPSDA